MIEVNLFSVPASDVDSKVGSCVARARVDIDGMGVDVMDFIKGFLRDNLDNLEGSIGDADVVQFINGNDTMTRIDLSTLKYILKKLGYLLTIWNVTDDEENSVGVGEGTLEYNVVNYNFLQHDFPTTTKLIPSEGQDIANILSEVIDQTGLYSEDKFSGVKNPLKVLLKGLEFEKEKMSNINATITTQIFNVLDQMGFKIFCATSEV